MRMDIIVIFLCIEKILPSQPVAASPRILQENRENLYGPEVERPPDEKSSEGNGASVADYVEEDLSDGLSPSEPEEHKIYDEVIDRYNQPPGSQSYKRSSFQISRDPESQRSLHMGGLVSLNRESAESKAIDQDMDDKRSDDFEDDPRREEQNEIDDILKKEFRNSDRLKRLTINSRKDTDFSSQPLENPDATSANENYGYYYDEKEFVGTGDKMTTKRIMNKDKTMPLGSALQKISAPPFVNLKATPNDKKLHETNGTEKDVLSEFFSHDEKRKNIRNKDKVEFILKRKYNESSDLLELRKAYNELVCAAEKFLKLANKTMSSKSNSECSVINDISKACTTCPTTNNCETSINCKASDGFSFSDEICTTRRTAGMGESTIPCEYTYPDDNELHSSSAKREDKELNGNINKAQHKPSKAEDVPSEDADQGGLYVYNDYDSVDPNEDYKGPIGKASVPPTKHTRTRGSTDTYKREKENSSQNSIKKAKRINSNGVEKVAGRKVTELAGGPGLLSLAGSVKAASLTPPRALSGMKQKERHGRKRKQNKRMKKMSSPIQKKRKKHILTLFSEPRDATEEAIFHQDITDQSVLTNILPDQESGAEVIELEYV